MYRLQSHSKSKVKQFRMHLKKKTFQFQLRLPLKKKIDALQPPPANAASHSVCKFHPILAPRKSAATHTKIKSNKICIHWHFQPGPDVSWWSQPNMTQNTCPNLLLGPISGLLEIRTFSGVIALTAPSSSSTSRATFVWHLGYCLKVKCGEIA